MIGPKMRLPTGTVPPKAMNHSAITSTRSELAMFCWNSVLIAVVSVK